MPPIRLFSLYVRITHLHNHPCLVMFAVEAALPSLEMSKRVRLIYALGFVMTMALQAAAQCSGSCERVSAPIRYGFGELKENLNRKMITCRTK